MWKTTPLTPATDRIIEQRPLGVVLSALALAAGLVLPASSAHAQAPPSDPDQLIVYDDVLRDGFTNWSSASTELASTEQMRTGTAALRADLGAGQRVFLSLIHI